MAELSGFLERIAPPQTPALILRRTSFEANLARMQQACAQAGVALRAHGKMHKSSRIGRMQVAAGAIGLCCQTVGEAEAFARAGIGDLLVTAPVPPWGAARLARLASDGVRVGAVVDSPAQVARLSQAALEAGTIIGVLADIDMGQHRAGLPPDDAGALVRATLAAPGLRWKGLQCYLGHLQHDRDKTAGHAAAMARLRALVLDLKAAGLPPEVVTGGGTGTAPLDLAAGVFTELQAGSYAFMDVDYRAAGADFLAALFLATTVVSRLHKSHVTVDAGLKALAHDGPPPRIVAGAHPLSRFLFQGDEHGAIVHPSFLPRLAQARGPAEFLGAVAAADADRSFPFPGDAPAEGGLVWLQPGHVDPTVNLHDALFLAEEDGRLQRIPIDARRVTPCG